MHDNQERRELIQGYLRIAQPLSEEDSEALEKIKTILIESKVGVLAKQQLAFQLIGEVARFLEIDLTR